MPHPRIYPDRVLSVKENNQRRKEKCLREGICTYCNAPNDRLPRIICSQCEATRSKNAKRKREETKKKVFLSYGGIACSCLGCNVREIEFLTLDHVSVDWRKERYRSGDHLYNYLMKQGYPPGYQVLCFNCNIGRFLNGGECPHSKQSKES